MTDLTIARLTLYAMVAGSAAAGLAVAAVVSGRRTWAMVALAPALVGAGCMTAALVGRRFSAGRAPDA